MVADKQTFITQEGLKKLQAELEELKTAKRKEIAERIREAKELGDLSENAEYQEAKDEQSFIERRISELEDIVRNVQVIKKSRKGGAVQVGSTIKVKNNELGQELSYTIVGSSEANPVDGKISNVSPMGQAFLGAKEGDTVPVQVPKGTIKFTIISIS